MATPTVLIQSTPSQVNGICYVNPGTPVSFRIVSGITAGASYQWYLNDILVSIGTGYTLNNPSLSDRVYMKEIITSEQYNNNYRVVDNTDTPSKNNVGTLRYITEGTNTSKCQMVMQTGTSTYSWVTITTSSW